jgi:hypothetical protein
VLRGICGYRGRRPAPGGWFGAFAERSLLPEVGEEMSRERQAIDPLTGWSPDIAGADLLRALLLGAVVIVVLSVALYLIIRRDNRRSSGLEALAGQFAAAASSGDFASAERAAAAAFRLLHKRPTPSV